MLHLLRHDHVPVVVSVVGGITTGGDTVGMDSILRLSTVGIDGRRSRQLELSQNLTFPPPHPIGWGGTL